MTALSIALVACTALLCVTRLALRWASFRDSKATQLGLEVAALKRQYEAEIPEMGRRIGEHAEFVRQVKATTAWRGM